VTGCNQPVTSQAATLTVNKIATTLAVAPATGNFGGTTTLSATLKDASNAPVNGATIAFTLKGASVGTATTNASGVATLSNVSLAGISGGTYTGGVAASFGGDATYIGSTGSALLTVNASATTLSVAPATGTFGGTVALSATLTAGGSGVNGKTVTFTLNGNPVGTGTTNASGVASLPTASLASINAGSYTTGVGASFAGDGDFQTTTASAALTVNKATTTIVWANPADIAYGTALGATQLNAAAKGIGGASVAGTFVYTPAAGTVLGAGAGQTLSASFTASDPNYTDVATTTVTIDVNRASLTVTTKPSTKVYGSPNPAFDVTYSGFVNG
jgi:hypothetical protein